MSGYRTVWRMSSEIKRNNMSKRLHKLIVEWHGGDERGGQAALAKALGVSSNAVSLYLRGTRPRRDILLRMAKHFKIDPEELSQVISSNGSTSKEKIKVNVHLKYLHITIRNNKVETLQVKFEEGE